MTSLLVTILIVTLSLGSAKLCTLSSQCADTEVCHVAILGLGTCVVPPSCQTDTDCTGQPGGGYYYCAGGKCATATTCSTDTDCDTNNYKGAVCVVNLLAPPILGLTSACILGPQCSVGDVATCPLGVCDQIPLLNGLGLTGVCLDRQTCTHNSECATVGSCVQNANGPSTCQVPPTCTADSQCAGQVGYYYCVNGRCVPYSTCATNADCASNYYSGGTCVPGPSAQGTGNYCIAGTPCQTSNPTGTCAGGVCHPTGLNTSSANDGACILTADSNSCTKNSDCSGNSICVLNNCAVPPRCSKDSDCSSISGFFYCDNGVCASTTTCSANSDCDSSYTNTGVCVHETATAAFGGNSSYCIAGPRCTSNTPSSCPGGTCHVTGLSTTSQDGTCIANPVGCTTESGCGGLTVCSSGQCTVPPVCTTDAQCTGLGGYYYCYQGRCAASSLCSTNADCVSPTYPNGQCVPGPSIFGSGSYCLAGPQCSTTGAAGVAACTGEGRTCHPNSLAVGQPDGVCFANPGACTHNADCADTEVCVLNNCEVPPTCTTDAQCATQQGYFNCVQGHCASTTTCSVNADCDTYYYIDAVCVSGPGPNNVVSIIGNGSYCLPGAACNTSNPATCATAGETCDASGLTTGTNNGICISPTATAHHPTFITYYKKNPHKGVFKGVKRKLKFHTTNKLKLAPFRFNGTAFAYAPSSQLVSIDTWVTGGTIQVGPFPKTAPIYVYIANMPTGKFTFNKPFNIMSKCTACTSIVRKKKSITVPASKVFSGILKFAKGVTSIHLRGHAKNKKQLVKFTFAHVV